MNNPLAQLKDIHTPDALSTWQIALGWYALGIIIFILLLALSVYYLRRHIRQRPSRLALKRLQEVSLNYEGRAYLAQVAQILKFSAMHNQAHLADCTGEQWQAILEAHMETDIAHLLCVERYQAHIRQTWQKADIERAAKIFIKAQR